MARASHTLDTHRHTRANGNERELSVNGRGEMGRKNRPKNTQNKCALIVFSCIIVVGSFVGWLVGSNEPERVGKMPKKNGQKNGAEAPKANLVKDGEILGEVKMTVGQTEDVQTEATETEVKAAGRRRRKKAVKGEKVISMESVESGLEGMIEEKYLQPSIVDLFAEGKLKAEIAQTEVKVNKVHYNGDMLRFEIGESVETDEDVIAVLLAIANGNVRAPFKVDPKTGETSETVRDYRQPSLEKFALYGADLSQRSRISQRVRSKAEGPTTAIRRMAKDLMKNKGWSEEKAMAKATAFYAEED